MRIRSARARRRVWTAGAIGVLAAAGLAATPAAALAASSVTYNGTSGSLAVVGDSSGNEYTLTATVSSGMVVSIAVHDGSGAVASPGPPCSQTDASTVTCTAALASAMIMGDDGNDSLSTVALPAGFPITFNGGNGNDRLDADAGEDTFIGGAGYDLVSYEALIGPVNVSADGVANDGEAGETDNIGTDVEEILGSEGADTLRASSTPSSDAGARVALYGNAGADTLNGGSTGDYLVGGPGDDVLDGGSGSDELVGDLGNDVLDGGGGDDQLDADPGADDIHGGADFDLVDYGGEPFTGPTPGSGVNVSLDGLANDGAVGQDGSGTDGAGVAGDNVHADVEEIEGSAGNDTLTGDDAANVLNGFSGDDTLTGGGGSDFLSAGDGNDTLQATDNTADLVRCGLGTDTASIDDIDSASDCESTTVTRATLPVVQVQVPPVVQAQLPVADTTPAKVKLEGLKNAVRRSLLLKRGVGFTLIASEAVSYDIELTGTAKAAQIARAGDLILASKTLRSSGGKTAVKLLLTHRTMKAIGSRARLMLTITAMDGGGNETTVTKKIKVE